MGRRAESVLNKTNTWRITNSLLKSHVKPFTFNGRLGLSKKKKKAAHFGVRSAENVHLVAARVPRSDATTCMMLPTAASTRQTSSTCSLHSDLLPSAAMSTSFSVKKLLPSSFLQDSFPKPATQCPACFATMHIDTSLSCRASLSKSTVNGGDGSGLPVLFVRFVTFTTCDSAHIKDERKLPTRRANRARGLLATRHMAASAGQ